MSLVHEHLIDVLNRRFVSNHFNTFSTGIGHDPEGARFLREAAGIHLMGGARYGALVTPDGKAVASFGFKRNEFVAALRGALASEVAYMWMTEPEEKILAQAADATDAKAQLAAAELEASLLRYTAARKRLRALIASEADTGAKARAWYAIGHLAAIDLDGKQPDACRDAFAKMGTMPAGLADDVAADTVWLDVELAQRPGFYTGWTFKKDVNVKAHLARIEKAIAASPAGNRVGQLQFLRGLAKQTLGDAAGADEAWAQHVERWPDDRFAMLSRIHHSGYRFSPTKHGPEGPAGGVVGLEGLAKDPARAKAMLEALDNGTLGLGGLGSDPAVRRMALEQLRKRLKAIIEQAEKRATKPEQPGSGKAEPEKVLPDGDR